MALKRACRLRSELSLISGLIPSCDSSSLGREAVAFFSFFFAGGQWGKQAVPCDLYDISSPTRDQTLGPWQ